MNPPFTFRELLEASTEVFEEMVKDFSDFERKLLLKSYQNHATLLRTWH